MLIDGSGKLLKHRTLGFHFDKEIRKAYIEYHLHDRFVLFCNQIKRFKGGCVIYYAFMEQRRVVVCCAFKMVRSRILETVL